MASLLAESERVWAFWFGGSVSDSFRSKWFPCNGAAAQAAADADVDVLFGATLAAALAGASSHAQRCQLRAHCAAHA